MTRAETIVQQTLDGMRTTYEAVLLLEDIKVHGAFADKGYTGYDYANQRWVVATNWTVEV